ncbi:hemolysin family protein [Lachnotalea sp. AF33-28]|uniref:hemolysin family protein n=1 Tax=Lachnotalea sp. AF33-28 TaxID=2292046 RepID=UPI000E4CA24A|nr:hemolysin family protein [Lachnotalea sp. AF33-28]RHP31259.1 HlyC/CorC family transporter [Lachnotalea sp. AF33-28]
MNSIPQQLLLQVILIMLNAFFAATEIAVISLNTTKLKRMSEEGDKTAEKLVKLVEEPAGFLSTIQIGITLAGFLGSAFAADNFSEYLVNWIYNGIGFHGIPLSVLDTLSVIVITLILSYFTLVFGELVPKRIAMQKPMKVARISCGVVSAVAVVMRPVVTFLSFSTNAVLKLLRMKTAAEEETVTEEEIRMMVDLGEEKGTIDSDEKEWIENVFEFGDSDARDVMTHQPDIVGIPVSADVETVRNIIRESGLSRFPVYGRNIDDIRGILNARDFLLNQKESHPEMVEELMRPAYFVPETVPASQLFKDMQKKKVHIAIVVDEYGETSGLVTMEDLLEEIVGNIYDEFDRAEPANIIKLGENLWQISGTAGVEDIAEELDVKLPEDLDYETLGGMVFSCLHTIPKDGTALDVEVCGLHIHVDQVTDRRIEKATVRKLEEEA